MFHMLVALDREEKNRERDRDRERERERNRERQREDMLYICAGFAAHFNHY